MVRGFKRSAIVFIGVVASALAIASQANAFAPRVPETFFGVSGTELWSLTESNRDAKRDAQLDAMKAAGIDWVRIELGWPEIERNAPVDGIHSYSWTLSDRLMTALASRGMDLMAVPMATPAWAGSEASACGRRSGIAQARVADYVAFVAAIAARYGAGGTFWAAHPELPERPITRFEIWNEPNWSGFWCSQPNPEIYAEMLLGAAQAIHAADADAEVIFGGLAALKASSLGGPAGASIAADKFLARALTHRPELRGAVDAVAFHPYDNDPSMNLSLIGWLRQRMNALGLGDAGIALTEFGWRSGGLLEGVLSELLRADNYNEMTSQVARTDCGITSVAAHTWQSSETNLLDPNHWYGLTSPLTGELYPSGVAYRNQVALFEGRGPTPAPRDTIRVCGAAQPPDQDGDGTPDEEDDFPIDPSRSGGSGEERVFSTVPEPEPEHAPRAEDEFFGVNVVQLPTDFTRLDEEFEAMKGAGIGIARQQIDWSQIEPVAPGDPQYEGRAGWYWLDRLVLTMARAGVQLRPAFGRAPAWAAGGSFDAEFAGFLTRFAERYGAGGSLWGENRNLDASRFAIRDFEIWQYANRDGDAPGGVASASSYAATYLAARAALKASDPGARAFLSLGEVGQTGRADAFLRSMVAARPDLAGAVDGTMLMADYSRTTAAVEGAVRDLRWALDDSGMAGSPISLGFGAPTAGTGALSESDRAQFFADVAGRAARGDCGVEGVFPHAWTTPETNPANPWHWFGIADSQDGSLSPTAEAYRDVSLSRRGFGPAPAEAAGVHPCVAPAPDRDGDGTQDPADPAPLDPATSSPSAPPPGEVTIAGGPASPTAARAATFALSAPRAVGFQCRLDSGRFAACGSSPEFTGLGHGEHTLRVRAVDDLGQVGPEGVRRWTVDAVGPNIVGLSGPEGVVNTSRIEYRFGADDQGAQIACRLDGNAWEWCTSPKTYQGVGEGVHEFRVGAYDAVGNLGPILLVRFEVRFAPAKPQITGGPAEGATVATARPSFAFSAPGAASYQCRFDQAAFGPCSGSGTHAPASDLANGPHTFAVRALDSRGAIGEAAQRTFTVDVPPPAPAKPQITGGPAEGSRVRSAAPTFMFTGNASAYSCRFDSGSWVPCSGSHRPAAPLADGSHTFQVVGANSRGIQGPVAQRTFVTDTTGPAITLKVNRTGAASREATVTISAADAAGVRTLECRLDTKSWRRCPGKERLTKLSVGDHSYAVRASDSLGNQSSAKQTWRVARNRRR